MLLRFAALFGRRHFGDQLALHRDRFLKREFDAAIYQYFRGLERIGRALDIHSSDFFASFDKLRGRHDAIH